VLGGGSIRSAVRHLALPPHASASQTDRDQTDFMAMVLEVLVMLSSRPAGQRWHYVLLTGTARGDADSQREQARRPPG